MKNLVRIFYILFIIIIIDGCEKEKNEVVTYKTESIVLNKDKLVLNTLNMDTWLKFKNIGEDSVKWNIEEFDSSISCGYRHRVNGYINPNEIDSIYVSANTEKILDDTIYTNLTLSFNNKDVDIPVEIFNLSRNRTIVNFNVVDADYDFIHNRILCISDNPVYSLRLVDLETRSSDSIILNYAPICISISPDFKKAVIGHENHVTYFDIESNSIIKTIGIDCIVSDIVIKNSGWAYAFSHTHNEENAYSIDPTCDSSYVNTEYPGISFSMKAKLHPSGKYIYAADNGVSPSGIEKYSIEENLLKVLYSEGFHGDYPIDGDLWISEDGNRIFTKSGYVFTTSEIQDLDIKYNGRLEKSTDIVSLSHSIQSDRIFAITTTNDDYREKFQETRLDVYDGTNLIYLGAIEMEWYKKPHSVNDYERFNPLGRFVFINSNSTCIYIISKGVFDTDLPDEWGIEKIYIE
ncbi:MAG: hypothetical protein JXB49_01345 [Bacteroidales bacterium]|nr:hypothetical protein [Bacteroidales bacterium]